MSDDKPDLPYPDDEAESGRTSGHSGSETSADRAHREDEDGTTTARQHSVLSLLSDRGEKGATWFEVAGALGWHHGQASGCLSVLHKVGKVARLDGVRRAQCAVYVLPQHVGDRIASPHGTRGGTAGLNARRVATLARIVAAADERGLDAVPVRVLRQIMEAKR